MISDPTNIRALLDLIREQGEALKDARDTLRFYGAGIPFAEKLLKRLEKAPGAKYDDLP